MTFVILNMMGVLAACILIFFGKKLFWFFVGMAGFLFGSGIIDQYFPFPSLIVSVAIGTAFGVACALVAPYFERIFVGLAGFVTGGYAALWLFLRLTPTGANEIWIVYLAGGILGFLLAWCLLDAALIVLSAVLGTVLLIGMLPYSATVNQMTGFAVFAIGLVVQIYAFQQANPRPPKLKKE